MTRQEQIEQIAKNNALVALDQRDCIEDYDQNMRDTIAELFPDWTYAEALMAEQIFNKIVGR